jgi:hypothetical protein
MRPFYGLRRPSFFGSLLSVMLLLFSQCCISFVGALAPPHTEFVLSGDYETVHEYRKRLNITYNYQPRHLSAERCRYLTEEQCRHDDEIHIQQAQKQRTIRQNQQKQQQRQLNPIKGDLTVLVLLCRFTDFDPTRTLPSRDDIDILFNGRSSTVLDSANRSSTINPVGSIREYLYYASMGQYKVTFEVRDWTTTANTERYYSQDTSGLSDSSTMQEMFIPLLDAIDTSMTDPFGWSKYDVAGDDPLFGDMSDGYFDHLVVLHSGWAAEQGNRDCAPDYRVRMDTNDF